MIRSLNLSDVEELLDIYNYYVLNSIVTFDDEVLSLDTFKDKIIRINTDYPFIVFEENNEILGYAYGSKWRPKPAYKHTVESTVYVKHGALGKQIGTKLYTELLFELKKQNYHVVIGGLTLPNDASVKLHEKFGFKQVAHFKEVGLKFGKWLDVGFWQLDF
ncbi:GNAT family N-acetyltransferase [Flavivirga spongiicola]|uniref:GNAT family N-acetyltransferase n=1 Tax=Flavivirga spongiicola TaxID=421621 RepID=A0ABU7XMR0_9FLAO|nr:GNAT family N-acetyltransferase [Flavivirga sp. MEBiC05379]MDO5981701.1 GNAT family N-acetyltransferase [Flavivirga sp. MEBiC05379]